MVNVVQHYKHRTLSDICRAEIFPQNKSCISNFLFNTLEILYFLSLLVFQIVIHNFKNKILFKQLAGLFSHYIYM